jgi:hypothetical protein
MSINIGVHTRHCCARHGCKYDNPKCPVVLGTRKAEHPCEYCLEEAASIKNEAHFLANNPGRFIALMEAVAQSQEIEVHVQLAVQAALKVMRTNV